MSPASPEIQVGTRLLFIDGTGHEVPHAVLAHFKFMHDLVSSLAESCARANAEIATLQAEETARRAGLVRWTPPLKEQLAKRSLKGPDERAAVLLACEISGEELDGWIARRARFGSEGLKGSRLQVLGRARSE